MSSVVADFDFNPRAIQNGESIRLYDKSYGIGEVVISRAWYIDGVLASTEQFPIVTPPLIFAAANRTLRLVVRGSSYITDTKDISFYTYMSPSSKPVRTDTFGTVSVFIYNDTNATILNRNWTPNCGFLFTNLALTESINKAGTATFTVVSKGTATDIEKGLLVADTYVAIISGKSVIWSGKILRSEQNVLTLFNSTNTSAMWDIQCESDISKMKLQSIESASIGLVTGSIGEVVSTIVTSTTGIDWNGTRDLGLRSNEGPGITFDITESDMYTQLSTLRNVIDFDVRTRMIYQRYSYTSLLSAQVHIGSMAPYVAGEFIGNWVLICGDQKGVYSFFKCSNNEYTIALISAYLNSATTIVNYSLSPATGTLLVLGDPVLDIVSDLSQPSLLRLFRMNYPPSDTMAIGYEFNDKTDKKILATKVVAKAKNSIGKTITAIEVAATPWDEEKCQFENSTTISKRTEGIVVAIESTGGVGVDYVHVEGWDFIASPGDYLSFKSVYGNFLVAQPATKIYANSNTYKEGKRVTVFSLVDYDLLDYTYVGASAFVIKAANFQVSGWNSYGSIYVKSLTDLGYVNGMDIRIGGEVIDTVNSALDHVNGYYINYLCDGTANHRLATSTYGCHVPGSIIWNNAYTETTPKAASPITYYGIISQSYSVDSNTTIELLEIYAAMNIIANSYYYRKSSFWCMVQDFFKTGFRDTSQLNCATFLSVGDRIMCWSKSSYDVWEIVDGKYKNIWQIISWTLDVNTMKVTVELGDFERNIFTLLADKTAAINQTLT